jgi:hypothetical protein
MLSCRVQRPLTPTDLITKSKDTLTFLRLIFITYLEKWVIKFNLINYNLSIITHFF